MLLNAKGGVINIEDTFMEYISFGNADKTLIMIPGLGDGLKTVKKYAEEAKVQIRNARRDGIEMYKKQKKDGEITEDDLKTIEKDIQDMTDKYIKEIDSITSDKEKEITEI